MRDVAARAGVDPALVHHYFGTKQRLFIAATEFPVDVAEVVPRLLAGGRDGLGERFVRFVVELWDRPGRPAAAPGRRAIGVHGRGRGRDDAPAFSRRARSSRSPRPSTGPTRATRATLAGSQLIGVVMARYIVQVEPLASMSPGAIATAVGPTIERYLYGDIGGDGGDRTRRPGPGARRPPADGCPGGDAASALRGR